jgi:hypothetical protein
MATGNRRWFLAGVFGAAALCGGCDAGTLAYFMMPETRQPAELKRLASDDKKREVRAVVLSYMALEPRAEFFQADRQLSELVAKQIAEISATNEERLTIVAPRKVEEYKSTHPAWHDDIDMSKIGRHFRADYVIYIEINSMGLYEKGSANQLYRGQSNVSVAVIDVNRPDDTPERRERTYVYPSDAKGPIPVDGETNPLEFRQMFLSYIAKRVAWCFTAHPKREGYYTE